MYAADIGFYFLKGGGLSLMDQQNLRTSNSEWTKINSLGKLVKIAAKVQVNGDPFHFWWLLRFEDKSEIKVVKNRLLEICEESELIDLL